MFRVFSVVGIFVLYYYRVQADELRSVVVLYRHGNRSPMKIYPKDPYKDVPKYWPDGLGELTNLGIQRQYELGRWFRKRYDGFLPETYSTEDIYVRSSDRDRTLMSAEANLAGLYPPKNSQVWNQNLLWRPIPIHTVPETEDEVIAMKKKCAKYDVLYDEELNSKFVKKIDEKYRDLYKFLSRNTGWNVTTFNQVETIYSLLSVEQQANLTLPNWTNGIFPEKLKFLAGVSHASTSMTKKLARLKNGPFFNYLFSHFDNVINNSTTTKFLMLSGHDHTIANVLCAMNLYDYECPDFAATVIWELRQNENGSYVNLFYKNTAAALKLQLPGCESDCSYEEFKSILAEVTLDPRSRKKECLV